MTSPPPRDMGDTTAESVWTALQAPVALEVHAKIEGVRAACDIKVIIQSSGGWGHVGPRGLARGGLRAAQ